MVSFKPGVSPDPSKGVAALDGKWVKQRHLSDMGAYSKQLDLMKVTGIKKIAAVQLFQGLHIRSDQEGMSVSIVAPRLPFGVTERFSLKEETAMKRRDGNPGKQLGRLRPVPGGIQVETIWDPPNSGRVVETYSLPDSSTLLVHSITEIDGKTLPGLQVYKRAR